jgi:hypothetical protein
MGEHLLQQTLAPDMAVMAEYYEQGMRPPTSAEAAKSRYHDEIVSGRIPAGTLQAILEREIDRLDESVRDGQGRSVKRHELALRALGAFVAADLVDREEAIGAARQAGDEKESLAERLDTAAVAARAERDRSSATATPRRDMNPASTRDARSQQSRWQTFSTVSVPMGNRSRESRFRRPPRP